MVFGYRWHPRKTRAEYCTGRLQENHPRDAVSESERLTPLWNLFAEFGGSLRVVAAIAEQLGLAPVHSLPLPLQGLTAGQRDRVTEVLNSLELE